MNSKTKREEGRMRTYRAGTSVGAGFLVLFGFGSFMWPGALHAKDGPAAAPARTLLLSSTVSVPMKKWEGRPVVDVMINGKGPFELLIDMGMSFRSALSNTLIRELELPFVDSVATPDGAKESSIVDVGTLAIGDATFSPVQAIRNDFGAGDNGPRGILGLTLFKDCLLTIDFPKQRVSFESGELVRLDGETIEYSANGEPDGSITVMLSVTGIPAKARLDPGTPALITLLNKFQKKLPLKGKPRVVGIARTPKGEVEVRSAVLDGVLKLGRHEWTNPPIDFADLGPMLDFDAGIIGSHLLKDFAITVDQKNHRVWFRRGEGGGG